MQRRSSRRAESCRGQQSLETAAVLRAGWRSRPQVEGLEARLPLGDTLLGLSLVAVSGLDAGGGAFFRSLEVPTEHRAEHAPPGASRQTAPARPACAWSENPASRFASQPMLDAAAVTALSTEMAGGWAGGDGARSGAFTGRVAFPQAGLPGPTLPANPGAVLMAGTSRLDLATLVSGVLAENNAASGRAPAAVAVLDAAAVPLSFDAAHGQVMIRAEAGTQAIHEGLTAAGFVQVTLDGQAHSSDPHSAAFDPRLSGATGATLRGITVVGGSATTLALDSQQLPGGLSVYAEQAAVRTQDLTTAGTLTVQAAAINMRGAIRGRDVTLAASGWVTIDAGGRIDTGASPAGGLITVLAGVFVNSGQVHADGASGGQIGIQADKVLNAGPITADADALGSAGGQVQMGFTDSYEATTAGVLSASSAAGPGGQVRIDGGSTGHLYSSGVQRVAGTVGGSVDLFGREVILSAATVDASGAAGGGSIRLGGARGEGNALLRSADNVTVTSASLLRADALQHGNGGQIFVWAEQATELGGIETARGGPVGGSGGLIEVSGHGAVAYDGLADAGARSGKSGTLLLDPKNLMISDPPGGVFPQFDLLDPHPTAGGTFGAQVSVLDTGNVVVTNPKDNLGGSNAGAVYLFDGLSGALLSALVGNHANDQVGSSSPTFLKNGTYLILSPNWNSGSGAITWADNRTGASGAISEANSLVGSSPGDQVGSAGPYASAVTLLSNGNYAVVSPFWNGKRGAVTWEDGSTRIHGSVTEANSLTGTSSGDQLGNGGIEEISNNHYLVLSPGWNGTRGAVTWEEGSTELGGTVSESNSLVGSNPGDRVGVIVLLPNGNYLVDSPHWNAERGAVTWGNASSGVRGAVSQDNSLIGSSPGDHVGGGYGGGIVPLSNGNYVVDSPEWRGGSFLTGRGAVTWGDGRAGVRGIVSEANSLVGSNPGDAVGSIFLSSTGDYLVDSPNWNSQRGAVTWGSGDKGISGTVSEANSLTGSNPGDQVGERLLWDGRYVINGDFVVLSPHWNAQRGAVTWINAAAGVRGTVSEANSLVGSNPGDTVGSFQSDLQPAITVLGNGKYVVGSPNWNGQRGAVTWVDSQNGISGTITEANSLVGSDPGDLVGLNIWASTNGNYLVVSPNWNGQRGAVTWADGRTGVNGTISTANSLVGSDPGDRVGLFITPLSNASFVITGKYVVRSPNWNEKRGALTWLDGNNGIRGPVSEANSLVGSTPGDQVGSGALVPLPNGNSLVNTPSWNGNRGAVTWLDGTMGITGTISEANSLVGSNPGSAFGSDAGDRVGDRGITVLANGNYLVDSPYWNGERGAVTWGNGSTGTTGTVSAANSLVGSDPGDQVGNFGVILLENGNYLVQSAFWHGKRGAVTWVDGTAGIRGVVSEMNSLVGGEPKDQIGVGEGYSKYLGAQPTSEVVALNNGNYLVGSPFWNGNRGAVTWGNGSMGASGPVSASNSIVGSNPGDIAGNGLGLFGYSLEFYALSNGNYVIRSPSWNGTRGAVTWMSGTTGQTVDGVGTITPQNSLLGTIPNAPEALLIEDPVAQTFLLITPTASGNRVTAAAADLSQFTYALAVAQSFTLTPALLTHTLDSGTAVVLQASNDITVNSPISVAAGGHGGALTLQAGRSIVLNASITTDNGPLTVIANDEQANGVVDAQRDPGAAVIAMAPGTALNTGAGPLTVTLGDGAGLSHPDSGAITLQNVTAGSVSVSNNGRSLGSELTVGTVTSSGPQSYASPNGTITVSGNLTAADQPITFNTAVTLTAGIAINAGVAPVNFTGGTVALPSGVVSIPSGVMFSSATALVERLNGSDPGGFGQLVVGGPISLGSSTLSLFFGVEPPVGSRFEIFTNTGNAPIVGSFSGLAEGAVFALGNEQFQIAYQGGTGGDNVVLTRLA